MDVLLLLAEESKYANRVRNDLVYSEIPREPLVISGKQKHYRRPQSRTSVMPSTGGGRTPSLVMFDDQSTILVKTNGEEQEYNNPPIDTSRRVNESEALYTKKDIGLKYTISDLQQAARGKKKISVRELRAIANRLGVDSTMRKPDLIRHIIAAYRRRGSQ